MRRMRLGAIMIALAFSSAAFGSPITISSGDALIVDSATNAMYDVRGSLDIRAGAEIASVTNQGEASGSVTMSGGRVDQGISVNEGVFNGSGGEAHGWWAGLDVGRAQATISGGTYVGGDSTTQAGSGVLGGAGNWDGVPFLSRLAISGGTFIGGTGSGGYYGGDSGYSLLSLGNTTVTGGQFLSPIAINAAYGGVTSFLGADLSYDDATHMLSGILQNGDAIHALLYLSAGTVAKTDDDGAEITFFHDADAPADPPTTIDPPPIPEPTSLVVFGLAAAFALRQRRRVRR